MRRVAIFALIAGVLLVVGPAMVSFAVAQITVSSDDRFAGLQWTFARVKYNSYSGDARTDLRIGYWEEPWAIDAPAAEQNLSRRVATVTSIQVAEPVVITLDDENIFRYPWLYLVEPSNLNLSDKNAATLREHLLRGGTPDAGRLSRSVRMGSHCQAAETDISGSRDRRNRAAASGLHVLLSHRKVPADPGAGIVFLGADMGEGRLRAPFACHPG